MRNPFDANQRTTMQTERLIQSGILHTGEPRHYSSWAPPEVPKLNVAVSGTVGEALYRRQKACAPQVRPSRSGWLHLWYTLRGKGGRR
jgi:hypothetical protein